MIPARMRLDYRLPLSVGYVKVTKSEHVHIDAGCDERHFRLLVPRNARRRVQRDGIPDHVDACLVDAMLPQEVARGICTVNFETLGGATVFFVRPMS
jgi:hypothetical protein